MVAVAGRTYWETHWLTTDWAHAAVERGPLTLSMVTAHDPAFSSLCLQGLILNEATLSGTYQVTPLQFPRLYKRPQVFVFFPRFISYQ